MTQLLLLVQLCTAQVQGDAHFKLFQQLIPAENGLYHPESKQGAFSICCSCAVGYHGSA